MDAEFTVETQVNVHNRFPATELFWICPAIKQVLAVSRHPGQTFAIEPFRLGSESALGGTKSNRLAGKIL